MKQLINGFLKFFNYSIRRPYSGFSLNYNVAWFNQLDIHTILDIGANEGQFAGFMNKKIPQADIYSFEPIEKCYNKLKDTFASNDKIKPFNFGIGDANAEVDFYLNDFTPSSSMLKTTSNSETNFPFTKKQSASKVQIKKLDDVVESLNIELNVLVKIDVQGVEDKVIEGGKRFLKENVSIVFIETSIKKLYENEPSFDQIYKSLINLGFEYMGNLDQLYSPINGEILQVDAIFMKPNLTTHGHR